MAYSAGGAALLALVRLDVSLTFVSFLTLCVAIGWLALVPLLRRQYLRALEAGLAGPVPSGLFDEPVVLGAAEKRMLLGLLDSPDPMQVLLALELLGGQRTPELRQKLGPLLRRPEPAVRARVIRLFERLHHSPAVVDIRLASADPDASVRAAAAGALSRMLGNEYPEQVLPLIDDRSREVRITATTNLIRFGGLLAATRAGERLLDLHSAREPHRRREACAVLAHLGRSGYQLLEGLLRDPVLEVRRAALKAASRNADPRFVPLFVTALGTLALRDTALTGLATFGKQAVPFIEEAIRSGRLPRAVRLELPRTLSAIPARESMEVLQRCMRDSDSHFRLRVFAAMGRLRRSLAMPPFPQDEIADRVRMEVLEACANLLGWQEARRRFETPLLAEEMAFRTRRAERRLLRLLELRYDRRETVVILEALETPTRRTEALEALDALLSGKLREWILPFLDRGDRTPDLPFLRDSSFKTPTALEFMLQQARHPNPYVVLLALDALSAAGEEAALPAARAALDHPDPRAREAGLRAVARLSDPQCAGLAARLASDPVAWVARWAALLRGRAEDRRRGPAGLMEDGMYGIVEKIALLRSTPLFSNLSGEDLSPLAAAAEFCLLQPGDTVFAEGDPGDHFFVVISGSVGMESRGREIQRLGPNEVFGELALFDRSRQHCSARALVRCELLRIGADGFFQVLREQPEVAESLLAILAAELRRFQQRDAASPAAAASPPHQSGRS